MLGLVDQSGDFPSYLAPPPPDLFERGWLTWGSDHATVTCTEAGQDALDEYARQRAAVDALPKGLTRNPLRGELRDPREPLRSTTTGVEIPPGATVSDPFGYQVVYLGPTMHSCDDGATWTPGFNVRVLYSDHVPWLFAPSELAAAYDDEQRGEPDSPQTGSASAP